MQPRSRKYIICVLILQLFIVTAMQPAAKAAHIPTDALIKSQSFDDTRSQLQIMLAREDVRSELIAMGVDPDSAGNRIGELTPGELQQLQNHMAQLPAGADAGILGIIGIVFLVLLLLDFLGVTNVFTKV